METEPFHCTVAWDIRAKDPTTRRLVRDSLKESLKGESWVRPLSGTDFFIVRLRNPEDREQLKSRFVAVAKANVSSVRLVVGPAVQGTYGGWLPKEMWPKVRKRTSAPMVATGEAE